MSVVSLKNCGLRIVDCGLPIHFPKIRNPKSEIRNRLRRAAISLTEVLIALGILTIGLLGVASIFPVGSWYMQKATIADQGSAIAQSVMNDAVTRGMLNPNSWYVMVPSNTTSTGNAWNRQFQCDGRYCPQPPPAKDPRSIFIRPFAAALSEAISQNGAAADRTMVNKQLGAAYVIDPIGVAAMAMPNGVALSNKYAYTFPASMNQLGGTTSGNLYSAAWQSWGNSPVNTWPIRRATIQQADGWQLSPSMADALCKGTDDLAVDLPKRDDRPAIQNWDTASINGTQMPMARQWAGDFSWMMTVVPTTTAARDGMASNPEGYDYQVSVVVFHKRGLPTSYALSNAEAYNNSALERAVKAKVLTTGPNGGELLLEGFGSNDSTAENPFSQLKTGNWIMLCGPHPNSSDSNPKFVLNWYQVLSIEGKNERLNNQGTTSPAPAASDPERRLVTLRGTEWPWQPAGPSAASGHLSNGLCVAICKGAVAVHTKTLRLENPHGGAFGSGASLVTPPGGTDSNNKLF